MLNKTGQKSKPKDKGQVGVRLDAETRIMLQELCRRWNCSRSAAIRKTVSAAYRIELMAEAGGKVLPRRG